MKLNPECIRALLFDIENETDFGSIFTYDREKPQESLIKYSSKEILYHVRQAYLANLITEPNYFFCDAGCSVGDLTSTGHEFINNIRQDTNWNKVKEIAKIVGSTSLMTLTHISAGVISSSINQNFPPGHQL